VDLDCIVVDESVGWHHCLQEWTKLKIRVFRLCLVSSCCAKDVNISASVCWLICVFTQKYSQSNGWIL